jgi:hypothetical protein
MADGTVKCGLSAFRTDECGSYYLFPDVKGLVKIKDCKKDVTNHLRSVGVAAGGSFRHFSSESTISEGELLLHRVGVFDERLYKDITVCPFHRYKLGIYYKQKRSCGYPSHSGNGKTYRGITTDESRMVLQRFGLLLPVGTGEI